MSEQLPCTLRSQIVSWFPFGSRRSKRRTRPSWCVVKNTSADPGANRSFMPMPASARGSASPSRPSGANSETACGDVRDPGPSRHRRMGRARSAAAPAKPRARSTRRTSPSPATVTQRLDPLFGTNSAEKMLCVCPVYTDPRQGNAVPSDHTQTHRSSLPLSNKEASSFQETAFTQPACFSRAAVKRRPRISHGCATCGSRRRRASHWRRVTPSYTEVMPEGSVLFRNIAGRRALAACRPTPRLRSPPMRKTSGEGSVTKVTTPTAPLRRRSGFPARRAFPRPRSDWRWRRLGTAPTSPGRAAASVEARGSEPNLTRHAESPKRQKKRWQSQKVVVNAITPQTGTRGTAVCPRGRQR